jgi:voltage-gated sodium channel type XI alpha
MIRNLSIKIADHPYFDIFIIILIIINTIVLSLKWYEEPKHLEGTLEHINYGFAIVFTIEAVIKIFAFRMDYFNNGWNIFDFFIVAGTLIGIVISSFSGVSVGPETTLIRSFRIGRIFRLVKRAKSLRMIFNTFVITLPSLANVGGLLMLLLYLYAVLGVFLFATVKLQNTLNVHANF